MTKSILSKIAVKTGVNEETIRGRSRIQSIAVAREMYWYLLNRQGMGHRRISQIAGRSKQTVSSGIRTVRNLIETNDELVKPYKELIR